MGIQWPIQMLTAGWHQLGEIMVTVLEIRFQVQFHRVLGTFWKLPSDPGMQQCQETLVEAKWGLPRKTQVNLNPEQKLIIPANRFHLYRTLPHFTDIILVKMLGPASKCNMQLHWESEIGFLNSPQGFSIPGFKSWGIFFSLATYPHLSHLKWDWGQEAGWHSTQVKGINFNFGKWQIEAERQTGNRFPLSNGYGPM